MNVVVWLSHFGCSLTCNILWTALWIAVGFLAKLNAWLLCEAVVHEYLSICVCCGDSDGGDGERMWTSMVGIGCKWGKHYGAGASLLLLVGHQWWEGGTWRAQECKLITGIWGRPLKLKTWAFGHQKEMANLPRDGKFANWSVFCYFSWQWLFIPCCRSICCHRVTSVPASDRLSVHHKVLSA